MSTDAEWRMVARALQAPILWAFAVVAGDLGLEGALVACDTRELPEAVTAKLLTGGWTISHLPTGATVRGVLLGARVRAWLEQRSKKPRKPRRVIDAAAHFGITATQAREALEALARYGGVVSRVSPRRVQRGDGGAASQ